MWGASREGWGPAGLWGPVEAVRGSGRTGELMGRDMGAGEGARSVLASAIPD